MLKAFQNNEGSNEIEKYMERIKEFEVVQEDEVVNIRQGYEKQLVDLRQKISSLEINNKNMEAQFEYQNSEYVQSIREKELYIVDLQLKIQQIESDK